MPNPYDIAVNKLRQVGQGVYGPSPEGEIGNPLPGSELMKPEDYDTVKQGITPDTTATVDPSVADYLFQKRISRGDTGNNTGELQRMFLGGNPLNQQAQQIQQLEAADRSARAQGFDNAQALVQFNKKLAEQERQLSAEKMRQPIELEKMREAADATRRSSLLQSLSTVPPGTEIDLGGGTKVKSAPTPIMPSGQATDIQKKINDLIEKRSALDRPDAYTRGADLLSNFLGGYGPTSSAQRKASYDKQIQELQAQLPAHPGVRGMAPQTAPPTQDNVSSLRSQAIAELQKAGHPATEANINYVIAQLSKQ